MLEKFCSENSSAVTSNEHARVTKVIVDALNKCF